MVGESEKNLRTIASRKFTRCYNRFNEAIINKEDVELIIEKYDTLKQLWADVQSKHDNYLIIAYPDDEDGTDNEKENQWIEKIEERFELVTKSKCAYLKERKESDELKVKDNVYEQEKKGLHVALAQRESLLHIFAQDKKDLRSCIKRDTKGIMKSQITGSLRSLKTQLDKCREAHLRYLSHSPPDMTPGEESTWIENLQQSYEECDLEAFAYLETVLEAESKEKKRIVKMETIKMPSFSGKIREYAKFKSDFKNQVESDIQTEKLCYVLRSCLKDEALTLVENIESASEIWERLDERYGSPSLLVDVIMNEIKSIGVVLDGDSSNLITFVNTIERGYSDLKRLNLEREISNSVTVGMLEGRLPPVTRREWSKLVNCHGSSVDPYNKFPSFMNFLKEQRKILEYEIASVRVLDDPEEVLTMRNNPIPREGQTQCLVHNNATTHNTCDCHAYINKSPQERLEIINRNRACWICLIPGHRFFECTARRECGENNCTMSHHPSLHVPLSARRAPPAQEEAVAVARTEDEYETEGKTLLPIMRIKAKNMYVSTLWDSAATCSMITFKLAEKLNLQGYDCKLAVTKVGGQVDIVDSRCYKIPLRDSRDQLVNIKVYGIDTITKGSDEVDVSPILHLFKHVTCKEIERKRGEVDVLIGMNFARFQPTKTQESRNLVLYENRFGKCIAGSHRMIKQTQQLIVNNVSVHSFDATSFLELETMGVQCHPRCGNCSCRKCALGSKGVSIKEEREQNMINEGLVYDETDKCFTSSYPWIKNPKHLPESYGVAKASLQSTERRLRRNASHAKTYDEQFKDLLDRGAAKILTTQELNSYNGPIYYLCHHEVMKEGSTTSCRIVYNSSRKIKGECINDYWGKGINPVNNLLGVLIRFRERKVVIVGDIRKMYHTIKINVVDQHTHRFLWRNMDTSRDPDVYAMQVVSFGDKPAGNIAVAALKKTAEMGSSAFPEAAEVILNNSYVDDILDSVDDESTAKEITEQIDHILDIGSFEIKEWVVGKGTGAVHALSKTKQMVLGMMLNLEDDEFTFEAKIEIKVGRKRNKRTVKVVNKENIPNMITITLTKAIAMSIINGIFDPLGLIGPFTVKGKMFMRMLWKEKFDWEDPLPDSLSEKLWQFFKEMLDMESIKFKRCLKPDSAVGDPILVTFSDASTEAFGAVVYLRWELADGSFQASLVTSKNRVAPLKIQSVPRLELCAAVIATRIAQFVMDEMRFNVSRRYFLIDSQIVKSMICKESHAFQTFVAVRLGEIHSFTKPDEFFWIDRKYNIADFLTKGKSPNEIGTGSTWQCPELLCWPERDWPINSTTTSEKLPEEAEMSFATDVAVVHCVGNVICILRFSKYTKLMHTTSRVIAVFKSDPKPSFCNGSILSSTYIHEAEVMWIKDAQKQIHADVKKGNYKKLCPVIQEDGIITVEGRVGALFADSYASSGLILLPHSHRLARLYAEHIHNASHLGSAAIKCKIRDRFWITKLGTMVNDIRNKCVTCKKLNAELQQQVMGPIPLHRLKPSPPFHNTYIDFFGPFKIRGVVNKRSSGKGFGVIFSCGSTRAVHCDLSQNYSVDGFLQTFRRFTSIRGYPSEVWSDCGTQLVATDKELRRMIRDFDQQKLIEFGAEKGITWHFSPPDAPWYNGCVEALVKSVKKAIKVAVGEQVLSFPELQCVLFEACNIVNERPIGVLSKDINDGKYLCPNNILLGRATSRVPAGPFSEDFNPRQRFQFVQGLVDAFWKIWLRDYFPSLLIRPKWHVQKRSMRIGDVVLIRDLNAVRGSWQMGQVAKVHPSTDQIIRHVDVRYKLPTNKCFKIVKRAVQSLVVLLPAEEDV